MATLAFKNAQWRVRRALPVQERRLEVQLCLLLRRDRQAGTLVTATDLRLRVNLGNFLLPKTTAQGRFDRGPARFRNGFAA